MNSLACINDCETQKEDVTVEFTPEIRIDKVLSMRRQLGEGRYYIAEKLDTVVDRLLEKLLNQ
jgi:hypothetical protein